MNNDSVMNNSNAEESGKKFSWRVPAIDGVRALAMMMVYAYHTWQFSGSPSLVVSMLGQPVNLLAPVSHFYLGVDLFMVLSGFCLFLPWCKSENALDKWDVRNYFARRLRRIVPPFYAAIVYAMILPQVLVVLYRVLGQEAKWQDFPSLQQLAATMLFVHSLFIPYWDGINGSFWSLGLEMQFYLVFPFVIWGFKKYGLKFLGWMIIVSVVYRMIGAYIFRDTKDWLPGFLFSITFLGRWMQFALGMWAAYVVAQHWREQKWRPSTWGTLALLGVVAGYAIATTDFVLKVNAFPLNSLLIGAIFALGLVALCVTKTPLRFLFENKVATGLGLISYSFFLIHQPTTFYLSELMRKKFGIAGLGMYAIYWTFGLLIITAIAYVFFIAFERPFLNTIKKINSSSTNSQVPQSATPLLPGTTIPVQDQAAP